MYSRHLEPLLIKFLNEFRVIYLTGPRQAGKSTLVRSVAERMGMDYFFDRGVLFYLGQEILSFKVGGYIFYALPMGLLFSNCE